MTETIYLLDFRRGVVEEIDERIPPRGAPASSDGPEVLPETTGYVLAALGSPPADDDEE
jgi:hypothetical protein